MKEINKIENEMASDFENTNKGNIMIAKVMNILEITTFVDFVRKNLNLTKLEIIVNYKVNIDVLHITIVLWTLHKDIVILYQMFFIILVNMIFIYSLRN